MEYQIKLSNIVERLVLLSLGKSSIVSNSSMDAICSVSSTLRLHCTHAAH